MEEAFLQCLVEGVKNGLRADSGYMTEARNAAINEVEESRTEVIVTLR